MYQYSDFDRQFVQQRAAQFRDQLERFQAGTLGGEEFKPLRLQNGWYIQRFAPMLRVAVPYGEINTAQLRALARLARDFDHKEEHDTSKANAALAEDPDIDGFIVQLPLPKHINENQVTLAVDPKKDVDGFHPVNFGRMAQGMPAFLPATPYGILLLLERYNIETAGKHVVVVGRSNIVGTPISILLSRKSRSGDATVTLAHSRTRDLHNIIRQGDSVVAAIGIPGFITEDMIKLGAGVIDVGINRVEDEGSSSGSRVVGDVDFESVKGGCSYITPVPGGVGPMTVIGLLLNTFKSANRKYTPDHYG